MQLKKEPSTDTSWKGNCYMNAIELLLKNPHENFKVVHGIVTGQGLENSGFRICHAWVEDDEYVYDHNAATNNIEKLNKLAYYVLGDIKITDTRRYKGPEIYANVKEHGHAGPWDKKLEHHAIHEQGTIYKIEDQ